MVEAEQHRVLREEVIAIEPTVTAQVEVRGEPKEVVWPNEQLRAWESVGDRLCSVWQRVWPGNLTQIAEEEYAMIAW